MPGPALRLEYFSVSTPVEFYLFGYFAARTIVPMRGLQIVAIAESPLRWTAVSRTFRKVHSIAFPALYMYNYISTPLV